MYTRRRFLGALGLPSVAAATGFPLPLPRLSETARILESLAEHPGSPAEIATDETYWAEVARAFTVDRSLVNLNNGGVSPAPGYVQEAMKQHLDYSNQAPVYTMWRILEPQREAVRQRVAREWGVHAEEIAFTRNASESLQTLQLGIDLEPGDEVLTTNQDYPRMITTFRQRERREGIVLKQFSIPVPAEDPADIVRRFEQRITPRTRLILMCHMINLTGQILPVREVVAMARRYNIPVLVDGAHALAHFDFKISDLECDNYSVSLHKWLFAPHGTGLLYVRRERIADVWPMMAAPEKMDDDIRKFEEIGTHPAAPYLAIAEALTFHQGIGGKRKEERLVYLRDSWTTRLLEHDRVYLHTSLQPGLACGIATVEIEGIDPGELTRVSPSVYTTPEEIDRFVAAMEYVVEEGLPA
jgi:selenocysteine lyase/cysteine desulfurase